MLAAWFRGPYMPHGFASSAGGTIGTRKPRTILSYLLKKSKRQPVFPVGRCGNQSAAPQPCSVGPFLPTCYSSQVRSAQISCHLILRSPLEVPQHSFSSAMSEACHPGRSRPALLLFYSAPANQPACAVNLSSLFFLSSQPLAAPPRTWLPSRHQQHPPPRPCSLHATSNTCHPERSRSAFLLFCFAPAEAAGLRSRSLFALLPDLLRLPPTAATLAPFTPQQHLSSRP